MKIYLIRHGESIGNAQGIHQGQKNDFSLSDVGIKQAEMLGKRFMNVSISAIYSSDLKRAEETAEIISKNSKNKVILDSRLRERDFGIIGEQKDLLKSWKEFLEQEISKGMNPEEARPLNGESDKDHFERVSSFLRDLIKNHKSNENILVVAHGGTNKVAFGVINHFTKDQMYKTPQGNTCVNEIVFENNKWHVEKINCTKHLEIAKEVINFFNQTRDKPLDVIKNRCWEKHIDLKKSLEQLGYKVKFKICSFKWSEQNLPPEVINLPHEDLDYHLFLTIKLNGLKLILDASNDSFLPDYNIWDGKTDCKLAVQPFEFIEENMGDIITKKTNNLNSNNQLEFLSRVNIFLEDLRKKKKGCIKLRV